MSKLSDLIQKLYNEVTPEGKKILSELIDKIIFELDCIRQTADLEEGMCACGNPKMEESDFCKDCI